MSSLAWGQGSLLARRIERTIRKWKEGDRLGWSTFTRQEVWNSIGDIRAAHIELDEWDIDREILPLWTQLEKKQIKEDKAIGITCWQAEMRNNIHAAMKWVKKLPGKKRTTGRSAPPTGESATHRGHVP